MRKLVITRHAGPLSGFMLNPFGVDQTPPTPGELDKLATGNCRMSPHTNDWLKSRRRTTSLRVSTTEEAEPADPRGGE